MPPSGPSKCGIDCRKSESKSSITDSEGASPSCRGTWQSLHVTRSAAYFMTEEEDAGEQAYALSLHSFSYCQSWDRRWDFEGGNR